MKKKEKVINKISILSIISIISIIIYIISLIIFFITNYISKNFYNVSFEQLLYNFIHSEGTSIQAVIYGILYVIILTALITIITIIIFKFIKKKLINKYYIKLWIKDKIFKVKLFSFNKYIILIISILLLLLSFTYTYIKLGMDEYFNLKNQSTLIYEDNYVDPNTVKLTFPKKKQNLIYIFVESLETTAASTSSGGAQKESYIPHLEELALKHTNFSNKENLGGAYQITGSGWTAAAMMAHTSGIPLNVSVDGNEYKNLGASLPGATSIGDVLSENGYKNYIMMGSQSEFGGRREYFEEHGNYEIYDWAWARKEKLIDKDYYVWWGFEDRKLFKFAKKQLKEISKKNEPFNFTLLTADTHFVDGYQDKSCKKNFKSKYANVHACSDEMIFDFVNWIMEQEFYKNTTIVLVGDHLTMQNDFYANINKNYDRTVFNTIINSRKDDKNIKNRLFSTLDFYPTTLASLGVEIEGNKLGLGTNLYSDELTILEKYGKDYVANEFKKKSFFYDNNILQDTYYKMEEKKKEESLN